jgi:Mce-associated membrane protein
MAEHSDAAEQIDEQTPDEGTDVDQHDTDADLAENAEIPAPRRFSDTRALITVGFVIFAALAGVGGWLGYRVYQDREAQAQRNLYVEVARQTAVNLTTIDYTRVDADIKRILDSATGGFYDDFQKRSQPFVDVVKKVQLERVHGRWLISQFDPV